jgi:hypothetical protein
MGSGALKPDVASFFSDRINQKPVWFDMAVTVALKVAAQRMIPELRWRFISGNQQITAVTDRRYNQIDTLPTIGGC